MNSSLTALWFEYCLFKSLSEFKRHNAIQNGVYRTAGKIANTGDIVDDFMDMDEVISPFCCRNIKSHQPLGMEWGPANEKRDHYSN